MGGCVLWFVVAPQWIDARARQLIDKKLKLEHQLAQFTYVADAASHKNRKYHQAVGHKYVVRPETLASRRQNTIR